MKYSVALGVGSMTAALLFTSGDARAQIGFETGTVDGTITRSDTSVVAFAEVLIMATDGSGSAWTTTDATGAYALDVPVGEYDITPVYPDFWIPIATNTVNVSQGAIITTDFMQAVGTLDGTMLRSAAGGSTAFPLSTISAALPDGGGTISVAADGSFSALVPVGDWTLQGRYFGFPIDIETATVSNLATTTATLVFPSGELDANTLENGLPREGIVLNVWEDHQFTGSCPPDAETTCEYYQPADPMDPMGQDMCMGCTTPTGRRFNCEHDGYCWYEETFYGHATSDTNGDVSIVLPEGQFTGSIQLEIFGDDPMGPEASYWGSFVLDTFPLTVSDGSSETRPQVAYSTGAVTGVVTLDGAPVPYAQVMFTLDDGVGQVFTQTDENGQYSLDAVTGDYRVDANGNGVNIQGALTTVVAGSQTFDLADTSGPGGGPGSFIQGVVTRANVGRANVQILVVDATPAPTTCPVDPNVCDHYEPGPPGDPMHEVFCDRCDDGAGRIFSCHDTMCWWEELYSVSAQTAPDGSWSVSAPPNPYTVTVREYLNGDGMMEPDGEAFWGEFILTTYSVTLGSEETIDLGTFNYDTGIVTGTVTACGDLKLSGSANLYNAQGMAWAGSGSDGIFSMEIPAGTYDASIDYPYAAHMWPSQVTVAAGMTSTLDHAFEGHGVVEGFVSQDGAPVEGARIELQEPPPQGCDMPGASCWMEEPEFCECEVEGRGFSCWSDPGMPELQECYWYDGGGNSAHTGIDGSFSARVKPGEYNVTAYTPEIFDDPMNPDGDPGMGGGGSFVIGTLQVNAFTCQTTTVGTADTPIAAIPPGGTSTVELTEDLTIELASTDGADAGVVSFVATNQEPIDEQPAGLIEVASLYYDFSSTIVFDEATICIPYDETQLMVPEQDLQMLHYDDQLVPAQWVDVTQSVDTVNDIVCGLAPHFSWYVLAQVEATDNDGDGIDDDVDNCPDDANADQLDEDGDGIGNVCDDDVDGDGVFNAFDDCAFTTLGAATDDQGCDSDQRLDARCPLDGQYKNHGKYVSCVDHETAEQVALGLLTSAEADAIVSEAARSNIGKKK